MGLVGAVLLGAYLPDWKRAIPAAAEFAAAGLLVAGDRVRLARRQRVSIARRGVAAADPRGGFSESRTTSPAACSTPTKTAATWCGASGRRSAISSIRAASAKQAYADYGRILYYADSNGGKSADELLAQYGIRGARAGWLRPLHGPIHTLAAALADPKQTEWKLVQADDRSIVFMRHPPPGVQPLNSLQALQSIEIAVPGANRTRSETARLRPRLADFYTLIGEKARAAQWMAFYESRSH